MLIGLLHYHLRGGGVTRVIEETVNTLTSHGHEVIVVCGEKPDSPLFGHIITHKALRYDVTPNKDQLHVIAADLERQIKQQFDQTPDLWHIHNHSLGKNTTVPLLASFWADRQIPLLLQIHDFAEDGRAANYHFLTKNIGKDQHLPLYPQASHVHYATLTRRDQHILGDAGFPDDRLHVLPNPVSLEQTGETGDNARSLFPDCETLILYPVRGIRRKNIGEFLLHSIIAPSRTHFAMTLAPKNPTQQKLYKEWITFARANQLPVSFEVGHQQKYPFPSVVRSSDLLMTTSITEGFGLTYLESWLADRPLCGRDLPEITGDFRSHDIKLDHLYSRLPVPLDWLPEQSFFAKVETALREMYQKFGREYSDEYLQQFKDAVLHNGTIDFGRLDEEHQKIVLRKLLSDDAARDKFKSYRLPDHVPGAATITHNKKQVRQFYSPDAYFKNLMSIYDDVINAQPGSVSYASAERVLDQFLKPERFYFLKSD